MKKRLRHLFRDLHRDESGPNTVEWVLLIIVALIVLVVIYYIVNLIIDKFKSSSSEVLDTEIQPN
jgi:Flp pilus assembly pilin Flp